MLKKSWLIAAALCCLAGESGFRLAHRYKLPGAGTWDYITVDSPARRVHVAHLTAVNVIDADTGKEIGKIDGMKGVHGVALAHAAGRGFITDGPSNEVVMFDLQTLKKTGSIPAGTKPDSIVFEPTTQRVFAANGTSKNVTVIDAASGKALKTIDTGGGPEFSVADGKGNVYVNIEDTNETLRIDAKTMAIDKRFKVAPCEEPSALAIDPPSNRLFLGCGNKMLAVLDTASGRVTGNVPIGPHVDAVAYDPQLELIFASTYDGSITVAKQSGTSGYASVDSLKTKQGSKTMGFDSKTHTLWLGAADFQPPLKPETTRTPPGTLPVPESFEILVFGK